MAEEVVGRVVDVHYADEEPPVTFRMRVVEYLAEEKFHLCDSEGLSLWDGESFDDTIDLNKMYADGHITFVDEAPAGEAAAEGTDAAVSPQPHKRLRKTA